MFKVTQLIIAIRLLPVEYRNKSHVCLGLDEDRQQLFEMMNLHEENEAMIVQQEHPFDILKQQTSHLLSRRKVLRSYKNIRFLGLCGVW